MLTVSDRIQIPSKTTHKDKGTKVNAFHYFISKYSVRVSWVLAYKKRTPDRIRSHLIPTNGPVPRVSSNNGVIREALGTSCTNKKFLKVSGKRFAQRRCLVM